MFLFVGAELFIITGLWFCQVSIPVLHTKAIFF